MIRLPGAVRRNWVTIVGLLCVIYIWAALCSAQLNGMSIVVDPGVFGYTGVALGACAAALLFCLVLIFNKASLLDLFEKVLPLVCAALLILARIFGDWSGAALTLITNMPLGFTSGVLGILAVIAVRREAAGGMHLGLLLGITMVSFALYFGALLLIWPSMTDGLADNINLALQVLFVTSVALHAIVRTQGAQKESSAYSAQDVDGCAEEGSRAAATTTASTVTVPPVSEGLTRACAALAERYELSPREGEILLLLAQGRGTSSIAKKLYVSSNTVKTHVKRIYQKCGIHTKEELIDLIYESVHQGQEAVSQD